MTKIAVSSTSFHEKNLGDLCEYAFEQQIDCIELSGGLMFPQGAGLNGYLSKHSKNISFYIHNYFPPPDNPFVLNLAHPETVERSYAHCLNAIDLCSTLGVPFYSIHAGMAFNPLPENLGASQAHLLAIDFKESQGLLISSCKKLGNYARAKGVDLLLENNVIASSNLINGVNDRYHLADPVETGNLCPLFDDPGINVLLDVGHLKVTAKVMGFDPLKFIEQLKDKLRVVHLSDNNGAEDQNMPIAEDSWFWPHIPWEQLEYVSLEILPQPLSLLKEQVQLTKKKIREHSNR